MSSDLESQIRMIETQCRLRRLSDAETREILDLCPFAFVNRMRRGARPPGLPRPGAGDGKRH